MSLPAFLRSVLNWVRAGYPEGLPPTDYIPLFALLGSQLAEDEVDEIADELALTGDADSLQAMKNAVAAATSEPPTDTDIARVRARLAAGGWPLAPVDREALSPGGTTPSGSARSASRGHPRTPDAPFGHRR
jgi:hypothetical protein